MGIKKYFKKIFGKEAPLPTVSSTPTHRYKHEAAKEYVGMANHGTSDYNRNAAVVLSQHAGSGMRSDTRAKLESLANSSDAATRDIARNALRGKNYSIPDPVFYD